VIAIGFGVLSWLVLGMVTSRLRGVSLPFLDSALTTMSVIAQVMMTRKILENWVLWIIADIVYVPMFIYKNLYVTAGLYAVFLGLALMGFVNWRSSWRSDREVAAA
jgi:nicotinamide mononucleotide transporter